MSRVRPLPATFVAAIALIALAAGSATAADGPDFSNSRIDCAPVSTLPTGLPGGGGTMAIVVGMGYYGAIAAVRNGIDPDTYGIPLVSAAVDLIGAITLIVTITALGLVHAH